MLVTSQILSGQRVSTGGTPDGILGFPEKTGTIDGVIYPAIVLVILLHYTSYSVGMVL